MFNHSRTVAAIAATSLIAAFAAHANKGAEYHANKHHHEHQFFITGGATLLQPSLNALEYVGTVPAINPGGITFKGLNVDADYSWGYYLAAGFNINHHYDLQVDWAQYNASQNDSQTGFPTTGPMITSNNIFFDAVDAIAQSYQTIDYTVFDATLGQTHRLSDTLKARLFAGVRWAKVDTKIKNVYLIPATEPYNLTDLYTSNYSGVGPELGLDLEYKLHETLGVVASFAGAFLVGTQDIGSNVFSNGNQVELDLDSVTRLVPGLDAKLGLNWIAPYYHDQIAFGVEAGYQVAYYFDVIDQVQYKPNGGPGFLGYLDHNLSNYGNMGPYLNLTAKF